MNFLFIFFLSFIPFAQGSDNKAPDTVLGLIDSKEIVISKKEQVIAEQIVIILKMIEKGYVSNEVISNVVKEISKSRHFNFFTNYFSQVKNISRIKQTNEIIESCIPYIQPKELLPMEKLLERVTGNYCRERALEMIGKDVEKSNQLTEQSAQFIKDHLRFFLTKKNRKNFAYFLQSINNNQDVLRKISKEITTYSVQHEVVPSHEVLKDLILNEDLTRLIQNRGMNTIKQQNVFYAEYGKLIEANYKLLDKNPAEDKVREHYSYLKNYLDLNQDHLPVELCLTRLNDLSKAVFRTGHKDLSREIFEYIIKKNIKEVREDAIFFYLWTYLFSGDYKDGIKIAKKYDLFDGPQKLTDARLKFWAGQMLEDSDRSKESIDYYESIVADHPLSYYAIMSVKRLQILRSDSPAVKFYQNEALKTGTAPQIKISDLGEDFISSLVRLRSWSKIDSQKLIKRELKRLRVHNMPLFLVSKPTDQQPSIKSDLHLLNAHILLESKNYLSTFKYLYQALENKEVIFNRQLLEILYPSPYLKDLTATLKKDKLDPIIVLSLIRQESVFNPEAKSPVGARGLMQLMPATAKRIKRSVREKHLVNPKTNLEVGTQYFKSLIKRYDGNLVYVLAAYNAGESRVEKWRNNYFNSDESILKNIESIPFLETRNYVKLIFRNIFFYKLLLDQKTELADSSDLNQIFDVKLGFKR